MTACGNTLSVLRPPAEIRLERVRVPDELVACAASVMPAKLRAEPRPTSGDFAERYVAALEVAVLAGRACLDEIGRLNPPPP